MFCTLIRVSLRIEFLVAHPNQCTTLTPWTDQKWIFTFFHIPWCKISNTTTNDYKILISEIIFQYQKSFSRIFVSRNIIVLELKPFYFHHFLLWLFKCFSIWKNWSKLYILSFLCAARNSNLESYLTLIQVSCGKPSPISRT